MADYDLLPFESNSEQWNLLNVERKNDQELKNSVSRTGSELERRNRQKSRQRSVRITASKEGIETEKFGIWIRREND